MAVRSGSTARAGGKRHTRRRLLGMAGAVLGGMAAGPAPAARAAASAGAGQMAQRWDRLLDVPFLGDNGEAHFLSEWAGRPVLLTFYATWCMPCRQEMPSMDRLAELRPAYAVLPISVDTGDIERLRLFYARLGLRHLGIYQDRSGTLARAAGIDGYPTTILVDAQGTEVDRVVGALHWSSPETLDWLDTVLADGPKPI